MSDDTTPLTISTRPWNWPRALAVAARSFGYALTTLGLLAFILVVLNSREVIEVIHALQGR